MEKGVSIGRARGCSSALSFKFSRKKESAGGKKNR